MGWSTLFSVSVVLFSGLVGKARRGMPFKLPDKIWKRRALGDCGGVDPTTVSPPSTKARSADTYSRLSSRRSAY